MESLIVLSGNCPFPSSGLHFMGEMRFHQKELLANKGYNTRFRNCVSEIMSQDASVNNLMLEYLKQNRKIFFVENMTLLFPYNSFNTIFSRKFDLFVDRRQIIG